MLASFRPSEGGQNGIDLPTRFRAECGEPPEFQVIRSKREGRAMEIRMPAGLARAGGSAQSIKQVPQSPDHSGTLNAVEKN